LRKLQQQFWLVQSGGGQLPDLITPMASPAGSLRIRLPNCVKPGPDYLKALNAHSEFAAQTMSFAPVKTLFFLCFWIFMWQLQTDNSQLPGSPPVV
jgi:hypothetical protein